MTDTKRETPVEKMTRERLAQIDAEMATLTARVEAYRTGEKNWGKAGDLGYIAQRLRELNGAE